MQTCCTIEWYLLSSQLEELGMFFLVVVSNFVSYYINIILNKLIIIYCIDSGTRIFRS